MTCSTRRPKARLRYTPHLGNIFNELLNTAVGDVVQKTEKRHFTNPAINVVENEDHLELQLAIPGFNKKNVTITVDEDILKIEGKEESNSEATYRLREFNYNGFAKSFRLPEDIDGDNISAKFNNGVLSITLNKKEEAIPQPPKTISIK